MNQIFWRWMREFSGWYSHDLRSILFVRREERGAKFGRLHYHLLLSARYLRPNISCCMFLRHQWKIAGGGFAVIDVFDPHADSSGYLSKGLSEARLYELGKFSEPSVSLILSDGLRLWLRRSAKEGGRVWTTDEQDHSERQGSPTVPATGTLREFNKAFVLGG